MSLEFHNTATQQREHFKPFDTQGKRVKIYTCGPTVYDFAHIGNFRAYVFEDLLQRHLEARGYIVDRVMNLTDVDDKTIRGCRHANVPLAEFTKPFKVAFFEDLKTLRIKPANHFPEATEPVYIRRMIEMIQTLIDKGYAYQADDHSVYFRIRSFPRYGQLAHINLEELQPSGRISNDEYEKENIGDFALWKAWDKDDGEVWWDSPWGRGRPGWHIECSAMATGLLGNQIDIHCGGEDNIFPHHEAEIAQTESVTNQPFVKLWMHCKHLMVDGKKMSKSEGNFYTLRDLLKLGWTGREVRYLLLSVRYREPLNFTLEGLAAARSALQRLDEWVERLGQTPATNTQGTFNFRPEAFFEALDDDLNISAALAVLFETIRESNRLLDNNTLSQEQAHDLVAWLQQIQSILVLEPETLTVPPEVQQLVQQRQAARERKDWASSDTLRNQIAALGWTVKDTKEGQQLRRGEDGTGRNE